MMQYEREIREAICAGLSEEMDSFLAGHGFVRESNSLDYIRPCMDGEQVLQMYFEFKPKHQPGASAHIYPWDEVKFPEVNRIAMEILGDVSDESGFVVTDRTLAQPIDFCIPKECHVMWFTYGRETVAVCLRSIQGYLETWVIPFLDEYATVESLTQGYERGDERLCSISGRSFFFYISAAYLSLAEPAKAMEVLQTKFGKARSRRVYANAFDYVARHLTDSTPLRPT